MSDTGLVFITTEENTCFCRQVSEVKEKVKENGVVSENLLLQLLGPSQSVTDPTHVDNVKILNISNCALKSLDASISLLVNLHELNVSGNQLDDLPDSFVTFKKLHTINLSNNRFQIVPSCISKLNFIINLNLSHNPISNFDEAPNCLSFLKRLTMTHTRLESLPKWLFTDSRVILELLNLSYNGCFTKPVNEEVLYRFEHSPSFFSKSLKKLDFSNCSASPKNLSMVSYFDNLQCLNVGNGVTSKTKLMNCLWDLPPSLFSNNNQFTSLSSLNISNASLSTLSEDIYLLSSLKDVDASHNELNWLPNNFSRLTNLVTLNLSRNCIAMLPADFSNLRSLKNLFLSHNQLDSFPAYFENLVNLEFTDFYDNYIEEYPAEPIKTLMNHCLKGLDFSWNKFTPPPDESYVRLQECFRASYAAEEKRQDTSRPVEEIQDYESDRSFSSYGEDDLPTSNVECTIEDAPNRNQAEDDEWEDVNSLDRFDPNLPDVTSRSSSFRSLNLLGRATPPVGYFVRDDIGPVWYPSDRMAFCPSDTHPPSIRAAKKRQNNVENNCVPVDLEQFEDP